MSNSYWEKCRIYFDGDDYYNAALGAIQKAQTEILLESYIFDLDLIGHRFVDALNHARKRGVHVRILVDGVGSFNWLGPLATEFKKINAAFRVYHPLPLSLEQLKKISWRSLRRLLVLFKKANKRNHRKVILIDRKIAFLGSLNISQPHSKEFTGELAWRDTGIEVHGPDIQYLVKSFEYIWLKSKYPQAVLRRNRFNLKKRKPLNFKKQALIRMNTSTFWRFFLALDLKKRIRRAKTKILITNAYFLPRRSFLRLLRKTAQKGVYVGVCVPGSLDVTPVHWATRHLYYKLLSDGVHIFEYQKSLLHAKTLVIDQWATIGSHNLNHRSLVHDLEVEAVVSDPHSLKLLEHQWGIDIQNSRKITLQDIGNMNWRERIWARFIYWWRYWL